MKWEVRSRMYEKV